MRLNAFALVATTAFMLASADIARAQAVSHFIAPQAYVSNGPADGPSMYWSATGDFNGDGRIDVAAPDLRSFNNILGFSVAFGLPGGGFDAPASFAMGAFVRALRAADFNHDGRADLLLVTFSGAVVVQGNADGSFGVPVAISLPLLPNDAALGDFNGDGSLDVVFPGDLGYAVALGTGTGTFSRGTLLPEAAASYWAVVGDFNHDGAQDFTGAGGIFGHTYAGNGDGTFQPPADAGFSAPSGTVSGDFNGDGNIDLATLSATPRQDGSNFGFKIAVGFGDGTFAAYIGYVFGQQPIGNLVTGDFNGDGLTDIAAYFTSTGSVHVLAGNTLTWIGADVYDSPFVNGPFLLAADVDGNGSSDLVLSGYRDYTVFRSTHGNPPLLAGLALSPAAVIGGVSTSGIVQLGGAAPADGVTVTLTTSDPALASLPSGATVFIPAGASSATFDLATTGVAAPAAVTVTAEANGVTQSVALAVVPAYALTGVSINPGSQYGIFSARGTLTLSAPADASATVLLSSENPAVASVPASVTVPAGATTVDFTIALTAVTADTAVTITGSRGGVSATASVTVLKPSDSVAITKAQLTRKTSDLKIEATSTSPTTTITVYNAATGALLGTLDNAGGGKYKGSVFLFVAANAPVPAITLKSALGGTTSGTVQVK
ncbi:MAG TPA: VCBS repeat-containing protein [Vicinamibacterales bacterium]|nr:VCBS repeat-containing protein [Vicinamibacterales bacterium]